MPTVFAVFLIFLPVAGALYAAWRIRYRYPPETPPPVLCYHKISRAFRWEGTWTTPARFFAAVDRLRGRGYRFVDESEYLAALRAGADSGGAAGERRLFLTFDDGYTGVYEDAFAGLVQRGVPFHVFLVTDYMGCENTWDLSLGRRPDRHVSWEQAREMARSGVTFGSHGATHRDLTRLDRTGVVDELVRSRRAIETELGVAVRTASYPFGRYNDVVRSAAREAGYEAAFSLYPRHPNERVDRWALRRNGVYVIDTAAAVEVKVARHPLFWFEEMKCRAINGVAVLTPMLKDRRRGLRDS